MSKFANAGELRTAVYFKRIIEDADTHPAPEENVFGEGVSVLCKWVNAHGTDVWSANQLHLRGRATLTLRYSPKLENVTLIVYRAGDPDFYEVVNVDNVEQRNEWLEITVQRRKAGR